MGAPGSKGATWRSPDAFPGVKACWRDVYQLGPLVQVGELVAAVGRRLRVAVEEQRAFAAALASGKDWPRSRGAGHLLLGVLHDTVSLARTCLHNVHLALVHGGGGGSAGLAVKAAGEDSADAAWCAHCGRPLHWRSCCPHWNTACCCALGCCRGRGGSRGKAGGQGGAATDVVLLAKALRKLTDGSYEVASTAVLRCDMLMTWYCIMPAGDWGPGGSGGGGGGNSNGSNGGVGGGSSSGGGDNSGSSAGGSGSGGGDNSGSATESGGSGGGSSGGGGGSSNGSGSMCGGRTDSGGSGSGAPCVADPAWRQLLLRDVRLMELLEAGVALQREEEVQGLQRGKVSTRDALGLYLENALPMAAACFPEEFRAAVGEAGAAACGRVAGAAGGASGSGLAGSRAGAYRPCISLPAVRAVMGGKGANAGKSSTELELVAGMLGDAGVRVGAQRQLSGLARAFRLRYAMQPGVSRYLGMLMPPEEARAARAAAAEAGAPAGADRRVA